MGQRLSVGGESARPRGGREPRDLKQDVILELAGMKGGLAVGPGAGDHGDRQGQHHQDERETSREGPGPHACASGFGMVQPTPLMLRIVWAPSFDRMPWMANSTAFDSTSLPHP